MRSEERDEEEGGVLKFGGWSICLLYCGENLIMRFFLCFSKLLEGREMSMGGWGVVGRNVEFRVYVEMVKESDL